MADKNLEMLLRIIAQVDGLRDVEGLRESVETLDPALSTLAERAKAAINPMEGLANSAHNFGQSVKATTQPLNDLAVNSLKVTSVIAALATALGGAVYQEAKKFESAQLDLKKVLGGTQEELDIYGKKLNALALEFGVSSNALTASMAEFVQAGFSADESLNLVTQSLKLKVAGDLEAAQSSEYLVKILKGFGAQAADSARFVDVLNEVSNRYATDVQQLAEAISRVSPIAKQMGLSFEEAAGALTPMIESFGSGAEAAEAFKTGVLKLIDDSKPVKDALLSMGVAQTDLNGNLRSGKDILNDVMVAFQTTGKEQKLYLTSQLVGIDQAPRMIEAFDNLNKVLGIQKAGLEAAGSAQQEVNIRLQSAETIAARSSESFRQLAVALGTNYRDEVKGVVDATGALARGFLEAEQAGSMDGLFAAVKPQLDAVENLFRQMAANLPAAFAGLNFSPLTSAITDLGGEVSQAFQAFMGSIDLTTVDGLRQAMQLIADSMAALIRFTAGAVDQMSPFFKAMGTAARFAAENADSISRLAGEVAGFSLTVNKLIPLLADMASGTFSVIGMAADAAFTIGLVVGAIKLLNLAGISVLPMLGSLATAIGGLGVGTATLGAAFLGIPGAMLAVAGAAGAVGVATYSATRAIADMTGDSWSLGSAIYDLAEAMGLENTEADQLRITNEQLTKTREFQAEAAKKQAEAERELALAAERARLAAQYQTDTALATDKANRQLAAGFQEAGLIWDKATGELVRVSDAMAGIVPASITVKNALRDLGIDYAEFSGGIGEGSEKLILSFKKITQDVTANAPIVAAALRAAVNKAETIGDLQAIEGAFQAFAETGRVSASEVAAAQAVLSRKFIEISQSQSLAIQNISALAKESSGYVKAVRDVVDAESESIKASIALAKAKGDTVEVQRLTTKLNLQEADGSVRVAKAKQAEQEMEYALSVAKLNQVKALKEKNQASSEDLALAELTVQKELAEAIAAGTNTEAQERLAEALHRVNGAKTGATESTNNNTDATNTNSAAQETQAKTVDNVTKLYQGMVQQLGDARNRMNELSATAGAYFEAVLQGTLNQQGLTGAFESSRAATEALNRALEGGGGASDSLAKFESAAAQAGAAQGRLRQEMLQTVNMLDTVTTAIELAEASTRKIYYEQAAGAERLKISIEEMMKSGQISAQQLRLAAQSASQDFNLLDSEDLSGLRSAIEAANDKLREMQNEAQDARDQLAELNAELAAERGDTDTADRLKLELEQRQALAELERRIQEAEMQGNRELVAILEEQRRKLEELYAIKERNLEQDIRSRRQQEESNSKSASSGGGGGNNNSSTVTSGSSTGGGMSNRSNAFSLTVNTTGGIIDSAFAEELARKLKPKLDEISRRSL